MSIASPSPDDAAPSPASACPCRSGRDYGACCRPWHRGTPAPTPVALMRSRYSAFALGLIEYLLATWHPSTRPATLPADDGLQWQGLEILADEGPLEVEPTRGRVAFRATFREGGDWGQLEERSEFRRCEGRWRYLSGDARWCRLRPGRNDPCPCGSDRKFKKCCAG